MEEPAGEGYPPSLQDLDEESLSSDSEETSSAESSSDSEQSRVEGLQSLNPPLAIQAQQAQINVAQEARRKRAPPKRSGTASSNSKKRRIEQPPSLSDTLGALEKPQLLQIILDFVSKHPEHETEFRATVPQPDLVSINVELQELQERYEKPLALSPQQPIDNGLYTKVRPHLMAYKRAIIRHASDYKKAKMWIPLLRYCDLATRRAEAMPDWEGKRYQKAKAATYKNLAGFWTAALKGARLAAEELVVWRDRLSKYNSNGPIIENKNGRTRVFNNTICQLDKLLAKSK